MYRQWKVPGVPQKGWTLKDIIKCRDKKATCMMCQQTDLRTVYVLTHPNIGKPFLVGQRCALAMMETYIHPGLRRPFNWRIQRWKKTDKGNYYLLVDGHLLVIYIHNKSKQYALIIGKSFDNHRFSNLGSAKLRAQSAVEYMQACGVWQNIDGMDANMAGLALKRIDTTVLKFFNQSA